MDDSLDSTRTVDEVIGLYNQLDSLWKLAGIEPRKWVSNSDSVLENIRDLKIYDAATRRRGFITKGIFIEDKSHE